ncbi:hypothetical protein HDU97_007792 [Phlyctochytrium planicorne]|nr:hypothetical protein HDU97_007792 [Phlyctochytrium planicorne]
MKKPPQPHPKDIKDRTSALHVHHIKSKPQTKNIFLNMLFQTIAFLALTSSTCIAQTTTTSAPLPDPSRIVGDIDSISPAGFYARNCEPSENLIAKSLQCLDQNYNFKIGDDCEKKLEAVIVNDKEGHPALSGPVPECSCPLYVNFVECLKPFCQEGIPSVKNTYYNCFGLTNVSATFVLPATTVAATTGSVTVSVTSVVASTTVPVSSVAEASVATSKPSSADRVFNLKGGLVAAVAAAVGFGFVML